MTLWKYRKKGSNCWKFTSKLPTTALSEIECELIDEKARKYGNMQ